MRACSRRSGTIEDPEERRRVIADLRDELLLPLGTRRDAGRARAGKSTGRIAVRASVGETVLELVPGRPRARGPAARRAGGRSSCAFTDPVVPRAEARHFGDEVTGGLGGLLVDLRDVPLRLPDRPERRRDLLTAWQSALWAGVDA